MAIKEKHIESNQMNSKEVYGSLLGSLALFLCVIAASYTARYIYRKLFPRKVPRPLVLQRAAAAPGTSPSSSQPRLPIVRKCHKPAEESAPPPHTLAEVVVRMGPPEAPQGSSTTASEPAAKGTSKNANDTVVCMLEDNPPDYHTVVGPSSRPSESLGRLPSKSSKAGAKESSKASAQNVGNGVLLTVEGKSSKVASLSLPENLVDDSSPSSGVFLEETNEFVIYKL